MHSLPAAVQRLFCVFACVATYGQPLSLRFAQSLVPVFQAVKPATAIRVLPQLENVSKTETGTDLVNHVSTLGTRGGISENR